MENEELPINYPVKPEGIIRKFNLLEEEEIDPTEVDRRREEFLKRARQAGNISDLDDEIDQDGKESI